VNLKYRPYACDRVFEIIAVPEPNNPLSVGFRPQYSDSIHFEPINPEESINVLETVPSGNIYAKAFVEMSHAQLLKSLRSIKALFRERPPERAAEINADWEKHQESMPQSDDVAEYLKHPNAEYRIPFLNELFNNGSSILCESVRASATTNNPMFFNGLPTQLFTNAASVRHTGNAGAVLPPPRVITANDYRQTTVRTAQQVLDINQAALPDLTNKELKMMIKGYNEKGSNMKMGGTKPELISRLTDHIVSMRGSNNAPAAVQRTETAATTDAAIQSGETNKRKRKQTTKRSNVGGDGALSQRTTTQSVKKRRTDDDNRSHSIIDDFSSGVRADDED
jgi:hypothetical protein